MQRHRSSAVVTIAITVACVFFPFAAFAQNPPPSSTYNLLAPLGQWVSGPYDLAGNGLSDYLQSVFFVGIGIAVALAIVMLVICGVRIIATAASISAKEEAKRCIMNAIVGLLLAIGAWVLLNTINPALVGTSVNAPQTDPINSSTAPPPADPGDYEPIFTPPGNDGEDPPSVPPGTQGALTVQFTITGYTVNETDGSVTLAIASTGTGGPGTVYFSTMPGSALPGVDYAATTQTLAFGGPGETRAVTIPIISDGLPGTTRSFYARIDTPTGEAVIGSRWSATITIKQVPAPIVPPIIVPPPPRDLAAPVITITDPTSVVFINASTSPWVPLAFTVTDDIGIKSVTVKEIGRLYLPQYWTICDKGNCPSPTMTHNMQIYIEPVDYGIHTITVRACDTSGKCTERKVTVYVQIPCINSSRLTCDKLRSGKSEVSPVVCSTSGVANGITITGLSATSTATTTTRSYEFSINDPAVGGGWVHVLSGLLTEYPPYYYPYTRKDGTISTGVTTGLCPAPPVCFPDEFGMTSCVPMRSTWCETIPMGESGIPTLVCPVVPKNVIASVSDIPGNVANGSNTGTTTSPVFGNCGNGGGMPGSEVNIYITASTTDPKYCRIFPKMKYYLNIRTIVRPPPPPGLSYEPDYSPDPNYSLFWNGIFD